MPETPTPIHFSDSFQLIDKHGVAHTFAFSGGLDQKNEILGLSAKAIKASLSGGWTTAATAPAHNGNSDPNTTTEVVMAERLIVTADESGKHFAVKGGKYKKFGVAVYPEYLEALGISEKMEPGGHDFRKKVVVQTHKIGEGKTSSKVIALA